MIFDVLWNKVVSYAFGILSYTSMWQNFCIVWCCFAYGSHDVTVIPSSSSPSGIGKGALAGIVLGAIAGTVALSAIVSLLITRRYMRKYRAISKRRHGEGFLWLDCIYKYIIFFHDAFSSSGLPLHILMLFLPIVKDTIWLCNFQSDGNVVQVLESKICWSKRFHV